MELKFHSYISSYLKIDLLIENMYFYQLCILCQSNYSFHQHIIVVVVL